MCFFQHNFAHFVHALRLFKALRVLFLPNFPGPMFIPCPTSIPDSRVQTNDDQMLILCLPYLITTVLKKITLFLIKPYLLLHR